MDSETFDTDPNVTIWDDKVVTNNIFAIKNNFICKVILALGLPNLYVSYFFSSFI